MIRDIDTLEPIYAALKYIRQSCPIVLITTHGITIPSGG